MGLIRYLLAVSIIFGHIPISNRLFLGAPMALESFFIISGYCIALVLDKKYRYSPHQIKNYIFNRFLRIFPVYWFILFLTILIIWVSHILNMSLFSSLVPAFEQYKNTPMIGFMALLNLVIFGQDSVWFIWYDIPNHIIRFTANFAAIHPRLDSLFLIPQSWALSLEFMFYFLAPFILSKSMKYITAGFIGSLVIRILLYSYGLNFDPWTYRFFPAELAFFLFGSLIYLLNRNGRMVLPFRYAGIAYLMFIGILIFYRSIPQFEFWNIYITQWVFYCVFATLLPTFSTILQRNWADSILGASSYPVFLSHILVSEVLHLVRLPDPYHGMMVIILVTLFSFCIVKGISRPLENFKK